MNNLKFSETFNLGEYDWTLSLEFDGTYVAVKAQRRIMPDEVRVTIEHTYEGVIVDIADLRQDWYDLALEIQGNSRRMTEVEAVAEGFEWMAAMVRDGT